MRFFEFLLSKTQVINHVSSFVNDCRMHLLFDITGIFYFLIINLIVAARCELGTARCEAKTV
jgi:hypothetical protein